MLLYIYIYIYNFFSADQLFIITNNAFFIKCLDSVLIYITILYLLKFFFAGQLLIFTNNVCLFVFFFFSLSVGYIQFFGIDLQCHDAAKLYYLAVLSLSYSFVIYIILAINFQPFIKNTTNQDKYNTFLFHLKLS